MALFRFAQPWPIAAGEKIVHHVAAQPGVVEQGTIPIPDNMAVVHGEEHTQRGECVNLVLWGLTK